MSNNTTNSGGPDISTLHITSSILFTIGFPTNLVIVYLVSKHRHLKNATNYLVSSLAVADLFVLICMLLWTVGVKYFYQANKFIFPSIDISTGTLSMLNVAAVSADRAIAVTCPLQYERVVTTRRSLIVISSLWFYSICILIAGLIRKNVVNKYYWKAVLYVGYGNFFVATLIIIICYALIFLIVLHKLKGSRKLEKIMQYTRYAFSQDNEQQELTAKKLAQKKRRHRNLLREIKVTGNVLLIVVPFTFGWTFFIGTHFYEEFYTYQTDHTVNFFMITIPWLLSGLNPIIYLLVNRSLRQTFCESFKKLFRSNDYFIDDSRLSILASLSRRASSARTSSTLDGNDMINPSTRHKKSIPNSARSSASMDRSASEETPFSPSSV